VVAVMTANSWLYAIFFAASIVWAAPSGAQEIDVPGVEESEPRNRVLLRALDKITARITEFELKIGEELRFGTLSIVARYCRTRPPIEPPETFAFIEIDDLKRGVKRERVFEGWMVASSPALNALEHPVYDVWVISCKMVAPSVDMSN